MKMNRSGIIDQISPVRAGSARGTSVHATPVHTTSVHAAPALAASVLAAFVLAAALITAGTVPVSAASVTKRTVDLNSGAERSSTFTAVNRRFGTQITTDRQIWLTGLKDENADQVIGCLSDKYDDVSVLEIRDDAFCDAEKYDNEDDVSDYDAAHCWAAAASNMLWISGWAGVLDPGSPEFDSEDSIFRLFNDRFTDRGGDTDRAIDWFFMGEFFVSGMKQSADLYEPKAEDGYLKRFVSSVAQRQYDLYEDPEQIEKITEAGPWNPGTNKGLAVFQGSLGSYSDGEFLDSSHAVTIAGIVADPVSDDFEYKYKSIAIIDSDNDATPTDEEREAVNALPKSQRKAKKEEIKAARPNSYTFYPLEYRYGKNGTSGWIIKGYGDGTDEWTLASIDEFYITRNTIQDDCLETQGTMDPFQDPDFTLDEMFMTKDPVGVTDPYYNADRIKTTEFTYGEPVRLNYFVTNRSYVDIPADAPKEKLPQFNYSIRHNGSAFTSGSVPHCNAPIPARTAGGSDEPNLITLNRLGIDDIDNWPPGEYTLTAWINRFNTVTESYYMNNRPKTIRFTIIPTKELAEQMVNDARSHLVAAEHDVAAAEQAVLDPGAGIDAHIELANARKALAAALKDLDSAKDTLSMIEHREFDKKIAELEERIEKLEDELSDAKYYKDITNYECRLSKTRFEYTGKKIRPAVKVKSLSKGDFTVKYKNNVRIGKATVTVTGVGEYKGKIVKHFRITKRTNRFRLRKKTKTFRAAALRKRAKSLRIKTVMPAKGAKGKVTYKVKLNAKAKKAVSFKAGKIKVKKGAKKGVYRLKVTAKAAGSRIYKRESRTAILTIRIK